MSILSGIRKQKKYIKDENGNFKLASNWTSTDTVELSDNVVNNETSLANATAWNNTYDTATTQPTGLTDLITKTTTAFENIKYLKNRTDELDVKVKEESTCDLNELIIPGVYILTGYQITSKINFPIKQPGKLTVTAWYEESNNQTFCRQDFDTYSTGAYVNARFSRIGIWDRSSGGGMIWNNWYSEDYFLPGESFRIENSVFPGYVEPGNKNVIVDIVLPKKTKYIAGISSNPTQVYLEARYNGKLITTDNNLMFNWNNCLIYDNHLIVTLGTSNNTELRNSQTLISVNARASSFTITFA